MIDILICACVITFGWCIFKHIIIRVFICIFHTTYQITMWNCTVHEFSSMLTLFMNIIIYAESLQEQKNVILGSLVIHRFRQSATYITSLVVTNMLHICWSSLWSLFWNSFSVCHFLFCYSYVMKPVVSVVSWFNKIIGLKMSLLQSIDAFTFSYFLWNYFYGFAPGIVWHILHRLLSVMYSGWEIRWPKSWCLE